MIWLYFLSTEWLIVGFLVCFRYIYRFVYKADTWVFSMFFDEIVEVSGWGHWSRWVIHILTLASISMFFVILAVPIVKHESMVESKDGIDIMLLLDVSRSMWASLWSSSDGSLDKDLTRLDIAKRVLGDFVWELQSDRVGLVVFAGKPFVSLPLTFDYDFVRAYMDDISVDTINQWVWMFGGTAIGDGILSASHTLSIAGDMGRGVEGKGYDRKKVIVLLTDGTPSDGTLDPIAGAAFAKEQWVQIYTVGVGSDNPAEIIVEMAFGDQVQQVPPVDEQTLQAIANITSWSYRLAEDEQTFREIFVELSTLTKTEMKMESVISRQYLWKWFAWVLLLCLWRLLYIERLICGEQMEV
jgi:Ca-activated chloride channel homolog